ncbi:MAG: hypothetical protein LUH18_04100 [Oscillospiraceae bacterium]|nr:hypothetical protein [Oscillospiraceae bacterium]
MTHLGDDEILELASKTSDGLPYSDDERAKMEHLKECEECYDQFYAALALSDAVGNIGLLSAAKNEATEKAGASSKILATIGVIVGKVSSEIGAALQQLDGATAAFTFMPAMSLATRGAGDHQNSQSKLEDINDEKTFVSFDPKTGRLYVQINLKDLPEKNITVTVKASDGTVTEIPMQKTGAILSGSIDSPKDGELKVVVAGDNSAGGD